MADRPTVIRAVSTKTAATWSMAEAADTITLDHETRNRRRRALRSDAGLDFLLDLPRPAALDEGDALVLEDGRLILVRAAAQRLVEITTPNPRRLLRLAWHIGNRHTPAEIAEQAIYIEEDHVLVEMVRQQGATVRFVERPFRPERGAYHGTHDHAD